MCIMLICDFLFIGTSDMESVFEFKCLSVNLDPCLKFKSYIHDVVKKTVPICSHHL